MHSWRSELLISRENRGLRRVGRFPLVPIATQFLTIPLATGSIVCGGAVRTRVVFSFRATFHTSSETLVELCRYGVHRTTSQKRHDKE